jgi:hypothetical protein
MNEFIAIILRYIVAGLPGVKTYLAAAGLLGLALWQLSEGQYETAIQSFLAALAAFGLRQAVSRS